MEGKTPLHPQASRSGRLVRRMTRRKRPAKAMVAVRSVLSAAAKRERRTTDRKPKPAKVDVRVKKRLGVA